MDIKTWLVVPFILFSSAMPIQAVLAPECQIMGKTGSNRLDTAQVVQRLIYCESGGQNVAKLDSNGKYSYGVLQIQWSTWNQWSKDSGITGEPMNKTNAVKMAKWAIENGQIKHWTEWKYAMGLQDKCEWQR